MPTPILENQLTQKKEMHRDRTRGINEYKEGVMVSVVC